MGRIPDEIDPSRSAIASDLVELVGRTSRSRRPAAATRVSVPSTTRRPRPSTSIPIAGSTTASAAGGRQRVRVPDEGREPDLPRGGAQRSRASCGIEIPESGAAARRGVSRARARGERDRAGALPRARSRASRATPRAPISPKRGLARRRRRALRHRLRARPLGHAWRARSRRAASRPTVGERAGLLARARARRPLRPAARSRSRSRSRTRAAASSASAGARSAADQEPKYLNTPESPIFRKREAFYGLARGARGDPAQRARGRGRGLLRPHRAARAPASTRRSPPAARRSREDHARSLRRRTRNVVLLFDGDEAGPARDASARSRCCCPRACACAPRCCRPATIPTTCSRARAPRRCARSSTQRAARARARDRARGRARLRARPARRRTRSRAVAPLLALVAEPVERARLRAARSRSRSARDARDVEAAVRAAQPRRATRATSSPSPARARPARRAPAPPSSRSSLLEHPAAGRAASRASRASPSSSPASSLRELIAALSSVAPRTTASVPLDELAGRLGADEPPRCCTQLAVARTSASDAEPRAERTDRRHRFAWLREAPRQERQRAPSASPSGCAIRTRTCRRFCDEKDRSRRELAAARGLTSPAAISDPKETPMASSALKNPGRSRRARHSRTSQRARPPDAAPAVESAGRRRGSDALRGRRSRIAPTPPRAT